MHRYMLILTQTIRKQISCQIFTNTAAGFIRTTVTVHPLHQKLGVPRTLLNRCDEIVTEEEDRKEERNTIKNALNICGYPDWTIKRVEENLRNKEETKGKGNSRKREQRKEQRDGCFTICTWCVRRISQDI